MRGLRIWWCYITTGHLQMEPVMMSIGLVLRCARCKQPQYLRV